MKVQRLEIKVIFERYDMTIVMLRCIVGEILDSGGPLRGVISTEKKQKKKTKILLKHVLWPLVVIS